MTRIVANGFLTLAMVVGITSNLNAQLQPAPGTTTERQQLQVAPTHTITGKLQLTNCAQPITTLAVEAREYFYIQNRDSFEIPNSPTPSGGGYFYDRLQVGNTILQQGTVLGTTAVTSTMTFKVGWIQRFPTLGVNVPWIENVQHVTAAGTRTVTAYRVIKLRLVVNVPPPPPNALWATSFNPDPAVTFFGAENTKEVGILKTSCTPFNF